MQIPPVFAVLLTVCALNAVQLDAGSNTTGRKGPKRHGAETYYLSPSGSDASSGRTSQRAWKSFDKAVPSLRPGDTLLLEDGRYADPTTGLADINCGVGGNAHNGTASAPITLAAQNERQAEIDSNGNAALTISHCQYWVIEGLHLVSADNPSARVNQSNMMVTYSKYLTIRRNILDHNNRYFNSHLMNVDHTTNTLVEENEFYYFARHGVLVGYSDRNEVRRNYCNSRGYSDISGGWVSHDPSRGDECVTTYPGNNNVIENNISEGSETVYFPAACCGWGGDDNQALGNISIDDDFGLLTAPLCYTNPCQTTDIIHNTLVQDLLVINPVENGWYQRSTGHNITCDHCSIFTVASGRRAAGFLADQYTKCITQASGGNICFSGDGTDQLEIKNSLISGVSLGKAVKIDTGSGGAWTYAIHHVNSHNTGGFQPQDGHLTNISRLDPQLGSCYVYLPAKSPLKGKASDGGDLGATALYAYEGGVLTSKKLWDPSGKFTGCGATAGGLNDAPGQSCFDVNRRLHVAYGGCSLPASYSR
jgi:hypothetical protein